MRLKVKKLHEDSIVPHFAHASDAGMDLFSVAMQEILPGEKTQISTGIALEIPEGYVGLIWDKSGISHMHGLKTLGGVIDSGYRGEIKVGLINLGKDVYTFNKGQKVAQMLIQKIETPEIQVSEVLDDSTRGEAGFGSTGQ